MRDRRGSSWRFWLRRSNGLRRCWRDTGNAMNTAHALGQFLRTLPHSAAATFLALFPIVDPFGGIPIFFSMTSSWTAQDRRRTAVKTGLWVFAILVTFLFFGRFVLYFFGISLPVLRFPVDLSLPIPLGGWLPLTRASRRKKLMKRRTRKIFRLRRWRCRSCPDRARLAW